MTDSFAATTGANIKSARISVRLTQAALSRRSGVSRSQIVKMEAGQVIPQLDEAVRIADVLHIPIQRLLTGKNKPSVGLNGTAHELYDLGIRDWVVSDAEVPGAFRRPEQVIALALRGDRPEVRILESLPYVLSQRRLHLKLMLAFAELYDERVLTRLAWLCDLTLTMGRLGTISIPPGIEKSLTRLTVAAVKPKTPDALGHPGAGPHSPVWKRWNIIYAGNLGSFTDRAIVLSAEERIRAMPKDLNGKALMEILSAHTGADLADLKRRLGIVSKGSKANAKKVAESRAERNLYRKNGEAAGET